MSKIIEIIFNENVIEATLNESKTAKKLLKILPVKSKINLWGNEVYFEIPMTADIENGKELMEVGNIAFWPPGNAFCIFFGPTPIGDGKKPRAASSVTVIGKITGENGIDKIRKIKPEDSIELRLKK
ncbi:MAG: cyclophilin-like fold protein [Actinobacteria bacterium]|nr:cyclophilin-like fold protein [Actinomycetota bacterium]